MSKKNIFVKNLKKCGEKECKKVVKELKNKTIKHYVKCIKKKKSVKNSKNICIKEALSAKEVIKIKDKLKNCMEKKCVSNIL